MARFDLDRGALGILLKDEPTYRVDQLWRALLEGDDPADISTLPKTLRHDLAAEASLAPALVPVRTETGEGGDTVKWLWELEGGARVETVLMHHRGPKSQWSTVCVSTQAGCAMACGFCATGQAGFQRNLSSGEILEQVVRAARAARPRRLSNVVFMGMGEPMANYDRMWTSVERIHHDLGLSARHITVSTVGIVPGIRRLGGEALPVNLAVSLHAANDELRDELVPINRRYPLAMVMEACSEYLEAKGRRLSFEWALIENTNDRASDADELAALAARVSAHVNLIPLNPTPGWPTKGTGPAGIRAFRDRLAAAGVKVTVRRNRGTDIGAACGQLRAAGE